MALLLSVWRENRERFANLAIGGAILIAVGIAVAFFALCLLLGAGLLLTMLAEGVS